MLNQHPITPPPPHLLKKFSAQAQEETKKRNGAGYLKTFATLCIEWFVNFHLTSNDCQIRGSEIQPPPELVQQWYQEADNQLSPYYVYIATLAAQWGADQELEACCEWLREFHPGGTEQLRAARRPQPLSLKELAMESVKRFEESGEFFADQMRELAFIRKALEQLDD